MLDGYEPAIVHQLKKPFADSGVLARAVNLWRLRGMVRRLIKQIQPDLVHAQTAGSYAWMAMFSGFHPYMVTPTGSDVLVDIHQRALDRFFTIRTLRRADLVHGEGEDTRKVLLRLGVDARKIAIMPLGVDVRKYAPGKPPREFMERHGLIGGKVVVSTRTFHPIHDLETMIRSAAIVLREAPDTKFLLVGDGVVAEALRELARSLGIERSFIFPGYVNEEEMAVCLQAADVYVSTSLSDSGIPASTAEAMACGLPVISTDAGDISQRIGDGGYIVPAKSPAAIAEKVLRLLNHDEERRRAGRRNRLYVEEHVNVYVVMKQMENLYSQLVDQFSARGRY